MALIKCTGCGHQISSRAKSCPKCGWVGTGEATRESGAAAEDRSGKVASASDVACDREVPAVPPQLSDQEDAAEWYYVSAEGRCGPVSFASLQRLAAIGEIGDDTMVWSKGMADWVALARLREPGVTAGGQEPVPVAPRSTPKRYIWALALAPTWGLLLQIIATETWVMATHKHLGYYSELWWIMVAANLLAASLDFMSVKKDEPAASGFGRGMFLLVPAYLFLRDRTHKRPIRFMVWVGSLLISLAAYLQLNGIYARISIG